MTSFTVPPGSTASPGRPLVNVNSAAPGATQGANRSCRDGGRSTVPLHLLPQTTRAARSHFRVRVGAPPYHVARGREPPRIVADWPGRDPHASRAGADG